MPNRLAPVRRTSMAAAVVGVVLCAATLGHAAEVRLDAAAGLDGLSRQGRWTAVRIHIDNPQRHLSGEVVLEWGEARVHHAVEIAAPSRRVMELYIRTTDVREAIVVRLINGTETIATVMAPVRMATAAEALTVCVRQAVGAVDEPSCTAIVPPESLPRSMRGYDAADEVSWQAGPASLDDDQRLALQRWRAFHEVENRNLLSYAPRPSWGSGGSTGVPASVALAVGVALSALIAASVVWLRSLGSVQTAYAAFVSAILLGTTVSALAGRAGPGSTAVVRHDSALIQVDSGAALHLRGTVEYPAMAAYAVRLDSPDSVLRRRQRDASTDWYDSAGRPTLTGMHGRGSQEQVEVEAVLENVPFAVAARGAGVRITNVSGAALTSCRFPAGFSRLDAVTLAPGASVDADATSAVEDPFFVCASSAPPLRIFLGEGLVPMQGTTLVAVALSGNATEVLP